MNFTFYTAGEIVFAPGKISSVGELSKRFGRKAMIVTRGYSIRSNGYLLSVENALSAENMRFFHLNFSSGEPTVSDVNKGAKIARKEKPDLIIGIGGGSTIDVAKAISGMATNPGNIEDYLEGVGKGLSVTIPSIPFIAVPTTSGTGSEVTKNAVISSDTPGYKKSIRSPFLIPNIALLDPELTVSVPAHTTAETGMDALTQLLESFVSAKKQPIPQALSLYGIKLAFKYLLRAVENPADIKAREGMMLSSLLSGICLANSGLGAAHGIAAALGALAFIPHGKACAMLIPKVMRINLSHCIGDFAEIATAINIGHGLADDKKADKVVLAVESLSNNIGIPTHFSSEELGPELVPNLVSGAQGSSMKGNPVKLTNQQIESIIKSIMEC